MKLGVFTVLLSAKSLEESLSYLKQSGVQAVELGAGGYPGKSHLNPDELLGKKDKIDEIKALLKDNNMEISALSCHGNPLHPNKEIA
ncbi:MAG: sugar phosphate isomerase/epimerase, partial [Clostridiaceae bacterium]|nr:sugar phosphate isomerase/epimerase [Clostridiaceae bacterium]